MWGTQAGMRMHVIHLASVLRSGVGCRPVFSRYPAVDINVPRSIQRLVDLCLPFFSLFPFTCHPDENQYKY
jgi:hypothetical protein